MNLCFSCGFSMFNYTAPFLNSLRQSYLPKYNIKKTLPTLKSCLFQGEVPFITWKKTITFIWRKNKLGSSDLHIFTEVLGGFVSLKKLLWKSADTAWWIWSSFHLAPYGSHLQLTLDDRRNAGPTSANLAKCHFSAFSATSLVSCQCLPAYPALLDVDMSPIPFYVIQLKVAWNYRLDQRGVFL